MADVVRYQVMPPLSADEGAIGRIAGGAAVVTVKPSNKHPGYFDVAAFDLNGVFETDRPIHPGVIDEFAAFMIQKLGHNPKGLSWEIHRENDNTVNSGRVYFIEAEGTGLVKIGYTKSVSSRLATLQTGSPVPLRIIATIPGNPALEREMHRRFKSLNTHGEWFRAEGELSELIKEACHV